MTDVDIRETANRVQALFAQNRAREAIQLLEQERRDEPRVVQEALDRYVAKGSETQLTALRSPGALSVEDAAVVSPSLQRLQAATAIPRFPSQREIETAGLTEAQQYDLYASIVMTRGNDAARRELGNGQQRVILGLRQENNTLDGPVADNPRTLVNESQTGTGVYDDRLVVLWKDANGIGRVQKADMANTEPTAQYDHHAGSDGLRQIGETGGIERRRIDPSPGFEDVTMRGHGRKIEGIEVNNDTMQDLGRLGQGTVEMIATTHTNPRILVEDFALRPSPEAVLAGRGQVQRDTNADGWFTQDDINGVQNLNNTFKIHSGSSNNTDSAGCQTIHPDRYVEFMNAVRGAGNAQDRWQYVLTATTPGMWRGVDLNQAPDVDHQQGRQPAAPNLRGQPNPNGPDALHNGPPRQEMHDGQHPRNPQHPVQPDPHQRPGGPNVAAAPAPFHGALLNDAAHPDNQEFQQIRGLVVPAFAKSGRKPNEEEIDNATAQLLVAKKEDPFVKEVHAVMFSKATDTAQAEKLLHAVYQPHGPDKAPKPQAYVQTDDAMSTPMAQSTQQLNSLNQAQTQQQALAQQQTQTQQQNKEQNQSPVQQMTGGVTMKGPSQA